MDQTTTAEAELMASVAKLTRDLRAAARSLTEREARFLVDAYYMMQRDRIRAAHQMRSLGEGAEPNELFAWLAVQRHDLEKRVAGALKAYAGASELGQWAQSIVGIGPIISAGLLANIDISRAETAGQVWRFAGLDPTRTAKKGEKRSWNGSLKRLCFLIGESFVKVQNNPQDTYGQIYVARKAREIAKNEAGDYAEQAARILEEKNYRGDTVAKAAYQAGKLPPAHIHRRAARYAVKLFLAHYHHVGYCLLHDRPPAVPFMLTPEKGHAHYIAPPNWNRSSFADMPLKPWEDDEE